MSLLRSMSLALARHCNVKGSSRLCSLAKNNSSTSEALLSSSVCTMNKANNLLGSGHSDFLAANTTFLTAQSIIRAYHVTNANLSDSEKVEKPEKAASPIKEAMKLYGKTVLTVYVSVGLVNLSFCYLAISNGVDMVGILSQLPYVGEKIATSSAGAGASTFMIAYFVHKMMAPIRISVTLTITPFIVKALRAKGLIKQQ